MTDDERPTYRGRFVYRYTVLVDVEASHGATDPAVNATRKLHDALADFNTRHGFAGLACLNDRTPVTEPFDLEAHERARQVLVRAGLID